MCRALFACRRDPENDEDDKSMESNVTGTSNHSSRAWSGSQVNLVINNKHRSIKNMITLDNGYGGGHSANYKYFRITHKCQENKMYQKTSVPGFAKVWFD